MPHGLLNDVGWLCFLLTHIVHNYIRRISVVVTACPRNNVGIPRKSKGRQKCARAAKMANANQVECDYCHKPYTPQRLKKTGNHFCSGSCRVTAHKADRRRECREERIRSARAAMYIGFDGLTGGKPRDGYGVKTQVPERKPKPQKPTMWQTWNTLLPDKEAECKPVTLRDAALADADCVAQRGPEIELAVNRDYMRRVESGRKCAGLPRR